MVGVPKEGVDVSADGVGLLGVNVVVLCTVGDGLRTTATTVDGANVGRTVRECRVGCVTTFTDDGACVGALVVVVGIGIADAARVGAVLVGTRVGATVGRRDGVLVGFRVGRVVGFRDGAAVAGSVAVVGDVVVVVCPGPP
jgi:hypothetical protein